MAFSFEIIAGDHLISHTVTRAVPSAQRGLTSVFEMGTGDPSQYGHRQIEASSRREAHRAASLEPKSRASFARDLRSAFVLEGAWRVVARSLPRRLLLFRMVSPGCEAGTRTAIWRQKLCTSKRVVLSTYKTFSTKLIGCYKACFRRVSA